ncbi:holin [Gordonia phage Verity]|uniref:Holin n=2 Tax=Zitchvirus TaxID=2948963 RepID=A0A514DIT6_9CAUD|nr:holin [Gordonia phage Verity]QDH93529.1 holin [Gordonia phage Verity]QPO16886.1 holin [Gordonia phage Delrey21]QXN74169.1 holin [Gordonia phage DoctorFroggo]URC17660.1 membrane protein [Gordonia phage Tardus]
MIERHTMTHHNDGEILEGELVTDGSGPVTVGGEVADLLERAIKTFMQTVLIYLGAGATVSVLDVPWLTAVQGALIATLGTVVLGLVQSAWQSSNPYIEALSRAARTFLASFAGAIPVVDGTTAVTFSSIPWGQAAGIAGTLAAVSLLTSLGSMNLGIAKGTPSLVRG